MSKQTTIFFQLNMFIRFIGEYNVFSFRHFSSSHIEDKIRYTETKRIQSKLNGQYRDINCIYRNYEIVSYIMTSNRSSTSVILIFILYK